MNLSEHFTLQEFLKSETAKKFNVANVATEKHTKNMIALCKNILEPLRREIDKPVIITSGYRSSALNETMGKNGYYVSRTSQHMKGEAADIVVNGMTNDDIVKAIKKAGIIYDQLIDETATRIIKGVEHVSKWIHISYTTETVNRMQYLKMNNGVRI